MLKQDLEEMEAWFPQMINHTLFSENNAAQIDILARQAVKLMYYEPLNLDTTPRLLRG